jgi:hypothetical protein
MFGRKERNDRPVVVTCGGDKCSCGCDSTVEITAAEHNEMLAIARERLAEKRSKRVDALRNLFTTGYAFYTMNIAKPVPADHILSDDTIKAIEDDIQRFEMRRYHD